ncbi:MAG TPA: bifunctional isocitrate dehydrogenase kinase/phosphatase [Acidimicrobiia bacterium]|nr:bifunctional isocitrate dehydrogenase kinase/phosphatase [Acidimicrobiia bacterium]
MSHGKNEGPILSDSRLASLGARAISDSYASFDGRYRIVTRRARIRFEERDWTGIAADSRQRLDLYGLASTEAAETIRRLMGDRVDDKAVWAAMKAVFSSLIQERNYFELAETFFNSVTRKIFTTVGVDPHIEFVDTDFDFPPNEADRPVYRPYVDPAGNADLVKAILLDTGFGPRFRSLDEDAALAAGRIGEHLRRIGALRVVDRAEMVDAVFYRGKAAYVVGRIYSGSHVVPLVLALLHHPDGIALDAVLLTENQVSILFSFARSYFHVDVDRPYDLVRFLRSLMPRKRLSELYIAVGQHKHGKTSLYRELLEHLATSGERFDFARGTRGLVMSVFTLPGFDIVIKVIKDRFPAPKRATRDEVRERYRMVFRGDRAGRLIDAQEYEYLQFDRSRFAGELLAVLEEEAGRTVLTGESQVVVRHAYFERRVIPLDIYLREADPDLAKAAIIDYGSAIKELAASGIFPGDLLLKNFGVTRHGRVVFYDYDELTTIDRCVFRELPVATNPDDEMSAEPWFAVGPDDVFPEEFERFLGVEGGLRDAFLVHHRDLLTAAWWKAVQGRVAAGEMIDVFPYHLQQRLSAASPS